MSLIIGEMAILHIPRTGGMWRRSAIPAAVGLARAVRPHTKVSADRVIVPTRDPVDWLSSFSVHLCATGTGWAWPWFHAAVDLYGLRPGAVAECLVYKPKKWKALVSKKCRRWNFDNSIVGPGLCDGFLESGLFAMDWIALYMSGGVPIDTFDFRQSVDLARKLVTEFGGQVGALDQVERVVNSIPHDHGASFPEDMVREIYRQHAKANL